MAGRTRLAPVENGPALRVDVLSLEDDHVLAELNRLYLPPSSPLSGVREESSSTLFELGLNDQ